MILCQLGHVVFYICFMSAIWLHLEVLPMKASLCLPNAILECCAIFKTNNDLWQNLFYFAVCLVYVAQALERDSGYLAGKAFLHKIFSEQPSLRHESLELFTKWYLYNYILQNQYSGIPNNSTGRNKSIGWKIFQNQITIQGGIIV